LQFGSFVTKSGAEHPVLFNSGLFDDGESLRRLGDYYAQAYLESGVRATTSSVRPYKGIPLAAV
jgi:orotate phosphoribosyltransferase